MSLQLFTIFTSWAWCACQTPPTKAPPSDLQGSQANTLSIGSGACTDGVINIERGLPARSVPRQHNVVPVAIVYSGWHAQSLRAGKVQGGTVTVDAHQLLGIGHWGVWAAERREVASRTETQELRQPQAQQWCWDTSKCLQCTSYIWRSHSQEVRTANSHSRSPNTGPA